MTVPTFRLDAQAVHLIERLEAARRTWRGQPEQGRAELSRIAEEHLLALCQEAGLMGDPAQERLLSIELRQTFLPRYLRLALDQNELEERGYHAWRGGDPIARAVATLLALGGAIALEATIRHPITLVALAGAFLVPFGPEIRAWLYGRRYRSELQAIVEDMGRIQHVAENSPQLEALPPRAAEPRRDTPQAEGPK